MSINLIYVNFPSDSASFATSRMLTETNFSEWKKRVEFSLGYADLDLAFRVGKLADLTADSTLKEKLHFTAWEKSNRLSLLFMRMHILYN